MSFKVKYKKRIIMKQLIFITGFILIWFMGQTQNNGTFKDERDGQTYNWVKIGSQIWMAENLNYEAEQDCWVYEDSSRYAKIYGRLYDWEKASEVCPDGWHLPTNREWEKLEKSLSTNLGSKLAGASPLWKSGSLTKNSAIGTSGFSALPAGHRYMGIFQDLGEKTSFWSSTELGVAHAVARKLNYDYIGIRRIGGFKEYGMSVRCIKNKH